MSEINRGESAESVANKEALTHVVRAFVKSVAAIHEQLKPIAANLIGPPPTGVAEATRLSQASGIRRTLAEGETIIKQIDSLIVIIADAIDCEGPA